MNLVDQNDPVPIPCKIYSFVVLQNWNTCFENITTKYRLYWLDNEICCCFNAAFIYLIKNTVKTGMLWITAN